MVSRNSGPTYGANGGLDPGSSVFGGEDQQMPEFAAAKVGARAKYILLYGCMFKSTSYGFASGQGASSPNHEVVLPTTRL